MIMGSQVRNLDFRRTPELAAAALEQEAVGIAGGAEVKAPVSKERAIRRGLQGYRDILAAAPENQTEIIVSAEADAQAVRALWHLNAPDGDVEIGVQLPDLLPYARVQPGAKLVVLLRTHIDR